MYRLFLLPLLIAAAAAQGPDPSITATASRAVPVAPETAVLELRVSTPPGVAQAQVLEALAGVGVKEEHLVGVGASGFIVSGAQQFQGQRSDITYSFQVSGPAAEFRDRAARLDELRQKVGDTIRQIDYTLFLSPGARTLEEVRRTVLPELFNEAKARAETLARAAGVSLGAVLSVNESSTDTFAGSSSLRGAVVNFGLVVRFARQ